MTQRRNPDDLKPLRITVRIARETAAAVLVYQGNPDNAVWLPRSQITLGAPEPASGDNRHAACTLTLPLWLARQNGLHAPPPPARDLFAGEPNGDNA